MTGSIFLDSSSYGVNETAGTMTVMIRRTGDTSGEVNVSYATNGDTAIAGQDFTGVFGTATIAAGADRVFVTVPILDDGLAEPTETFNFSITSIDSGQLLFPRTAIVSIFDNEQPASDPPEPPLVSNYTVTQEAVATGLDQPISFVFSPVDPALMYIAEKGGVIKVFDTDANAFVGTFIDLSAVTNGSGDRGLLDIVLHPGFPEQPYLYAFYTVDPPESASLSGNAGLDGAGNRYGYVVRFEADPATGYTTVKANVPPVVLVGGGADSINDISGNGAIDSTTNFAIPASDIDPATGLFKQNYIKVDSSTHMGGSLEFGPDGMLYVSIGDGASFDQVDPRAASTLDVNSLSGKILRIDPITGQGLADNPFAAGHSLDDNAAKVYQLGLRNPYAMAITDDGRVILSETGWFSWEEINSGPAGANFGWPFFEGGDNGVVNRTIGYEALPEAIAYYAAVQNGTIQITPGIRAFSHIDADPGFQIQGIVGADSIYTGSRYPASLASSYFFTDVSQGEIYAANINNPSDVKYLFSTPTGFGPVHFEQGPDGFMYYADLITGVVGRLAIAPLTPEIAVNGSASFDAATRTYTLTADQPFQAGTAMSARRIDLSKDFEITFQVSAGGNEAGGDGISFLLHNDPRGSAAIGGGGSGLGVDGIISSFGIEIDTYDGTAGDIAADHTGFFSGSPVTGGIGAPVALPQMEDGAFHTVVVRWSAAQSRLSYTVDGAPAGEITRDIPALDLGGSDLAYFGFGAGTGQSTSPHQVRISSADVAYEIGELPEPPPQQLQPLPGLELNGSAAAAGSGILTLTPDAPFAAGTAMAETRIDVTKDFTIAFRAYLGTKDGNGADGIAFVLHNDPRGADAIGGEGGGHGVAGIANGLALELNTFGGSSDTASFLDTDGAFRSSTVSLGNLEDGAWHDVIVRWDASEQTLAYLIDGIERGSLAKDIAADFLGGGQYATFGLGGGTGGLSNLQQVELTVANASYEPPPAGTIPALALNGNATFDAARQVYTLTADQPFQRGTVMSAERIDLDYDFRIDFAAFLGGKDGADGIAFVLHNDPRGSGALGLDGGNFGVKSIANGLAIELDTWDNIETGQDIAPDHTSFFDTDLASTFQTAPAALDNLEDGRWHDVSVHWDAGTQTLTYLVDGVQKGSLTGDLATQFLGGSDLAWFGFGGGTGGATNRQEISIRSVDAVLDGDQPDHSPVVAQPTPDMQAVVSTPFSYLIPAGLFSDQDPGDTLRLSVTMADGSELPDWLDFADGRITAEPEGPEVGTYDIRITATDSQGNTASDVFVLSVTDPAGPALPPVGLSGSASETGGIITLTPDAAQQTGAAMSTARLDLSSDFRLAFDLFAGTKDAGGADGLAFVLHNDPRGAAAIGAGGSGLGYAGIANGLALEIDTFDSGAASGDIASDHTRLVDTDAPGSGLGPARALTNVEDGAWHRVVVSWDAETRTLSYDVDSVRQGSMVAPVPELLDGSLDAWFGFTAATGGLSNLQRIRVTELDGVLDDGTHVDFVRFFPPTGGGDLF